MDTLFKATINSMFCLQNQKYIKLIVSFSIQHSKMNKKLNSNFFLMSLIQLFIVNLDIFTFLVNLCYLKTAYYQLIFKLFLSTTVEEFFIYF